MCEDVKGKLHDALMGKGGTPDKRTPEERVDDFFDAMMSKDAEDIPLTLLLIMSRNNVSDLVGQLQTFESQLLDLMRNLTPDIPELRKKLLDSSQRLGHSPLSQFQIDWGSTPIVKDTAVETLAEAISLIFSTVMCLLKLPPKDLTLDRIREQLSPLNLDDYKRCCAAARAELIGLRTPNVPPLPSGTGNSNAKSRRRRSRKDDSGTAEPDTFTKLTGALSKHHEYENGQADDGKPPIGVRELAEAAGVSPSRATDFFNAKFNDGKRGGYEKYKRLCGDKDLISHSLRILNGDLTPAILSRTLKSDPAGKDDDE